MKKIRYKFSSLVILTLITSGLLVFKACVDLEEEVFSEILTEKFTPNEKDILAITISAYTPLRTVFAANNRWYDLQEETGNCIVTATRSTGGWDDGGIYKRNHFHDWNSELPFLNYTWVTCYSGIAKCNQILYQIESGELSLNEQNKTNAISELKSLRVVYYYVLLDLFGNIPLVTDFKDLSLPKTTKRTEIFNFIEKELLDNLKNLHPNNSMDYYARITQPVARAILMRIYLNSKVYTGKERYQNCIDQCNEILKIGYQFEDYLDPFKPDNEKSKENIFVVLCDDKYATGAVQFLKSFHAGASKVYEMSPQAWNGSFVSPQFLYSYQEGDMRKQWTWLQGVQRNPKGDSIFTYYNDINDIYYAKVFSGYRAGKYLPKIGLSSGNLSNDWVIVRLAEVYYAKAECLLRLGGAANEKEAAELVSEVRKRSFTSEKTATIDANFLKGVSNYPWGIYQRDRQEEYVEEIYKPGDPLPETITERQIGDDIQFGGMMDEWLWEFAAEGHNRMVLIRFGAFTTKKWFNHRPNTEMGEKIIIFPIPQTERNKNNGLDQNPGY